MRSHHPVLRHLTGDWDHHDDHESAWTALTAVHDTLTGTTPDDPPHDMCTTLTTALHNGTITHEHLKQAHRILDRYIDATAP